MVIAASRPGLSYLLLAVSALACGSGGSSGGRSPGAPGQCSAAPPPAVPERGTLLVQNGHSQPINVLTLSGDGRVLGSASLDGTLRIWDTKSGLLLRVVRSGGAAYAVSLSRDGQIAAYAEGPSNAPTSIV